MDGLDTIIEKIRADARAQAEDMLRGARDEAGRILGQARTEADAVTRTMEAAAEAEAGTLVARAESAAAMAARRDALDVRRRRVTGLVDQAVAHLAGLPAEDKIRLYADFLRQARGGETVVCNAADLADGIGAAAIAAADRARADAGQAPAGLALSDVPGDFLGGLVLRRGLIEDNLTFEMITRQAREDLEAYAASLAGN